MEREEIARDEKTGIVAYTQWDEDAGWHCDSPREWEGNVGRLCLFHRRYDFPNELDAAPQTPDKEDLEAWGVLGIWTVYAYEHGAITVRLGNGGNPFTAIDPGNWDSGALGFIAITEDSWEAAMGDKPYTEKEGEKQVEREIRDYDAHINGYYKAWIVEKDGEIMESCHGYLCPDLDDSDVVSEAKHAFRAEIEWEAKDRAEKEARALLGDWGALADTIGSYAADRRRMADATA